MFLFDMTQTAGVDWMGTYLLEPAVAGTQLRASRIYHSFFSSSFWLLLLPVVYWYICIMTGDMMPFCGWSVVSTRCNLVFHIVTSPTIPTIAFHSRPHRTLLVYHTVL